MKSESSQNVLILGCGYVGTALARHWQSDPNIRVTATTTTPDRLSELETIADEVLVLKGDDEAGLRTALAKADRLILSIGAKRGTPYAATYLKTAETLVRVLQSEALTPNHRLRQIVYTSSYAVYGNCKLDWANEETPTQPANENGEVLVQAEETLMRLRQPQRHVCVFRLGGIYGPGRELAKIFKFAAGKTRPGDGSAPGNWVHLDDIVGAIAFAITHDLDGLYNLVDSNPLPRKVLLDWVCQRANLAPIQWDPSLPSQRPYNARVSNQKLRDAGYHFQHPSVIPDKK